jgi:hypothetical protein
MNNIVEVIICVFMFTISLLFIVCGLRNYDVVSFVLDNKAAVQNIHNEVVYNTNDGLSKHIWFNDMSPNMQSQTRLLAHEIQEKLQNFKGTNIQFIPSMTELALTSRKQTNSEVIFFTNHIDAPFVLFPCQIYRVIVGIHGCSKMQTVFPNKTVTINTYDTITFDYDRTPHHIVQSGDCEKRILLKLQFHVYGNTRFCKKIHTKWALYSRQMLNENQSSMSILCKCGIIVSYVLSYFMWIAIIQMIILALYLAGVSRLFILIVCLSVFNILYIIFCIVFSFLIQV